VNKYINFVQGTKFYLFLIRILANRIKLSTMQRALNNYPFVHVNFFYKKLRYSTSTEIITKLCNNKKLAGKFFIFLTLHSSLYLHTLINDRF